MRGLFTGALIAVLVAISSPFLWSLVRIAFTAEPVTYVGPSGTQQAWLGPRSPWPEWAIRPDTGRLTVKAHFAASPGQPAIGYGDFRSPDAASVTLARFADQLALDGWTTRLLRKDTLSPDLPPRKLRICMLEASKGARTIWLSLDTFEGSRTEGAHGVLWWVEGERAPMQGFEAGAC